MYTFVIGLAKFIIWLVTGKITIYGKEKLPKNENYILVAPHRTWWDPVWYAVAALPKRFIFMAKKELFKNKLLGWFIGSLGAFSVDRQNPGPSAIKIPVKELKNGNRSLIIFPSGSRHSSDLAAGAVVIAKLSGKKIIPAVYQGPVLFMKLFHQGSTTLAFGDEIVVDRNKSEEEIILEIQNAFDKLDKQINPNFVYVDPKPKEND